MFRSMSRILNSKLNGYSVSKIKITALVNPVSISCFDEKRCYSSRDVFKMESINDNLFKGLQDRYKGITVESQLEQCDTDLFSNKLKESLESWISTGKRAIWFKVDVRDSEWVPILSKNGFNFHHAREGFVMMYKWLPEKTEPCNIPPYAHTNLGVGAAVINANNQVLVVCEKYFEMPHWKLPGGYVEQGEDIIDAAIREVKEETGIDSEFHSVVSFRHAHKMMFGNSDIYVVVNLIPTSHEIKQCERELVGCQWMDVDEYLNHPNVHVLNRSLIAKTLEYRQRKLKISGVKDTHKMITMQKEFTIFTLTDA